MNCIYVSSRCPILYVTWRGWTIFFFSLPWLFVRFGRWSTLYDDGVAAAHDTGEAREVRVINRRRRRRRCRATGSGTHRLYRKADTRNAHGSHALRQTSPCTRAAHHASSNWLRRPLRPSVYRATAAEVGLAIKRVHPRLLSVRARVPSLLFLSTTRWFLLFFERIWISSSLTIDKRHGNVGTIQLQRLHHTVTPIDRWKTFSSSIVTHTYIL